MRNKHFVALVSLILIAMFLMTGCSGASKPAKTGDVVYVHYTGKLQDGTVFETSAGSEPLEFTLGEGRILPAFERAVTGMKIGEAKSFTIPADEAYGQRRDDLIIEVPREELPDELLPAVGMQLQMNRGDGSSVIVTIMQVSETTVTIDTNHSLAGQDLSFDIELVGIGSYKSASRGATLTSLPLERALSNGKPTVAEFGSSSCIPCKQMKPILEQLAVDYEGKVNVVIIDIYEQTDITRRYQIMGIPTQIVFDSHGKEVTRHIGVWQRESIIAELKKIGIE